MGHVSCWQFALRYITGAGQEMAGRIISALSSSALRYLLLCFFFLLAVRERKYKKETVDEMAAANLKRCDSICYKISMVFIVCIAFVSAILRFTISSEIIGYMLMGVLVLTAIVRTAIFCYMDAKGI